MTRRMTISVDDDLAADITDAAQADELTVSAWIARSAERALKNRNLLALISEYESQHGDITEEELQRAELAWQASR